MDSNFVFSVSICIIVLLVWGFIMVAVIRGFLRKNFKDIDKLATKDAKTSFPQPKLPNEKTFINPTWEIEVRTSSGRVITKLPFCFMVHTYLKDYGFDPDFKLINPTADVILRLDTKAEAKLPLYLNEEKFKKVAKPNTSKRFDV